MGRKLDLSGLTDNEAEHVLEVVKRDMKLRKKEEERLSELRQELDEEGSRCLLLSRQSRFNQRCCIRCCSPFTFLLNPKRTCSDCHYNVCRACRVYVKRDRAWLCTACQKSRLLKTQSLEWFYNNVKSRFKRFGSAKVLKTLYRKHLLEHSTLTELTEGSAYEESVCNEGSICGSDSAFYRQSEEHSMAETLTVALRVAEEAIDEAIGKAEFENTSQERQNEAHYLRQHRGELIEELAKTIVQKIISRRKTLAEMKIEYEQDWHAPDSTPHQHHHHHQFHQASCKDQASSSFKHQASLWRSRSAFSLLDNDPPGLIQDSPHTLKREGSGSAMSTWKSVDRLDNAGVSSVFTSTDGNWIALQSAQLSRPTLLTKRKSPVYSALERESAVVSAYEDMGSDNETRHEPDNCWGGGLQEIRKKMTDPNFNQQSDDKAPLSVTGQGSRHDQIKDPEGNWEPRKPLLALLKRSMSADTRVTSGSSKGNTVDVNYWVELAKEEEKRRTSKESVPSLLDCGKKGSQTQVSSGAVTPDTLLTSSPELFDLDSDTAEHDYHSVQEFEANKEQAAGCDSSSSEADLDEVRDSGSDAKMDGGGEGSSEEEGNKDDERPLGTEDHSEGEERERDADEEEMRDRLCRLVAQARLSYFASTEDELDKVGGTEGDLECDKNAEEEEEEEEEEVKTRKQPQEKVGDLPYRICQLEREVRASQFSSTEDELDRAGTEEDEEGVREELALKVCRLANQVNATQFSSTEDELDRAGRGEGEDEEEATDEETLWKLQAERAIQAAQRRDLPCLVSPSQFPPSEGLEMDEEAECQNDAELESSVWERTESLEDLDVGMFDPRVEPEESRDGEACREKPVIMEESEEKKVAEKTGGQSPGMGPVHGETVLREAEGVKETENVLLTCETPVHRDSEAGREEAKATQEDVCDGTQTPDNTAACSDDEDEEFNRIISSMLMMTLEDMQGGVFDGDNAEEVGKPERAVKNEEMRTERRPDGQIPNLLADTGSLEQPQSQGQNVRLESAAEGRRAEDEALGDRGDVGWKRQSSNQSPDKENRHPAGKAASPAKGEDNPGGGRGGDKLEETGRRKAPADGGEDECRGQDAERRATEKEEESGTSHREGPLSPQERHIRHSAVSLCNITTEVLKVLNATEELLHGVEGGSDLPTTTLPPNTDPKKLDQQFSKLEENVYVAAGTVYGLEAELNDLEECARGISSATSDVELSYLEEQVATAAGKVQQSELQVSDISARIAALKSAGLDVDTQARVSRTRAMPVMAVTLDPSRQQRRRLPAPPVRGAKET